MTSDDHQPVVRFDSTSSKSPTKRDVTFRLLSVADLGVGGESEIHRVDKNSFAKTMESFAPSIRFEVHDHLGFSQGNLPVSMVFKTLSDFSADDVARAVPETARMIQVREMVQDVLSGASDPAEIGTLIRSTFGSTPIGQELQNKLEVSESSSGKDPAEPDREVGNLLDEVDLPENLDAQLSARSLADLLVSTALPSTTKSLTPQIKTRLESLCREIDTRLTAQVGAIVAQGAFRSLEASWRSLKFLIDRTDFRSRIVVDVLPAKKADFLQTFYDSVFLIEYEGLSDVPLSSVVLDYTFDRSQEDLDILQHASEMAMSLQTPILASLSPSYWGVRHAKLLTTLPSLIQKISGPEYARWRKFQSDETSRWLALAFNRFLLRQGWGDEGSPVEAFRWDASIDGASTEPLWGSGAWALAVALTHSFSQGRLSFPMVGPSSAGVLEDLPTRSIALGSDTQAAFPLEVRLNEDTARDLRLTGVAALVGEANRSHAFFASSPMHHSPTRYADDEATRSSFLASTLPYQAFAALASHEFQRIAGEVGSGLSTEETLSELRGGLIAFLANVEDSPQMDEVELETVPSEENPEMLQVIARLRPKFQIYGGDVDLVLGTSLAI